MCIIFIGGAGATGAGTFITATSSITCSSGSTDGGCIATTGDGTAFHCLFFSGVVCFILIVTAFSGTIVCACGTVVATCCIPGSLTTSFTVTAASLSATLYHKVIPMNNNSTAAATAQYLNGITTNFFF